MAAETICKACTLAHTYVVDQNHHIVYMDNVAESLFPHAAIGDICYESLRAYSKPCKDCPWRTQKVNQLNQKLIYNQRLEQWVEVSCIEVDWPDHGNCLLFAARGIEREGQGLLYSYGSNNGNGSYLDPSSLSLENLEGFDTEHLASLGIEYDPLTKLCTQQTFLEKAEALLRNKPSNFYEMLAIDIEHFKIFNEKHGREAGDALLASFARTLMHIESQYCGLAGYFGGDDFLLMLPQGTATNETLDKRLIAALKNPSFEIECPPAIGVCNLDDPAIPISTYCDHAMTAANLAKGNYASRIIWYEATMTEQLEREPKELLELQRALQDKEFILFWQPKCNVRTGHVVGLEALVRWEHPERGIVAPGAFIPLLEKSGLIVNLDLFVWEEACRQLRAWIDQDKPTLPVSVNISRADLQAIDVPAALESLIQAYHLDHSLLEVEITESAFAEGDMVLNAVNTLKRLGFTVLMDDFGSGYSSLNMLKDINVDIVKIDMRFLGLSNDDMKRGESILEAIINLAHFIGLPVIAEGAETKEQVDFLKSTTCDFVQGFYFYRPMPLDRLEALLANENSRNYESSLGELVGTFLLERGADISVALNKEFGTASSFVHDLPTGMIGAYCHSGLPLLFANDEAVALFGYSTYSELSDSCQSKFASLVHPDDLEELQRDFDFKYYEGKKIVLKKRFKCAGGDYREFLVEGKVVRTKQDKLVVLFSFTENC